MLEQFYLVSQQRHSLLMSDWVSSVYELEKQSWNLHCIISSEQHYTFKVIYDIILSYNIINIVHFLYDHLYDILCMLINMYIVCNNVVTYVILAFVSASIYEAGLCGRNWLHCFQSWHHIRTTFTCVYVLYCIQRRHIRTTFTSTLCLHCQVLTALCVCILFFLIGSSCPKIYSCGRCWIVIMLFPTL